MEVRFFIRSPYRGHLRMVRSLESVLSQQLPSTTDAHQVVRRHTRKPRSSAGQNIATPIFRSTRTSSTPTMTCRGGLCVPQAVLHVFRRLLEQRLCHTASRRSKRDPPRLTGPPSGKHAWTRLLRRVRHARGRLQSKRRRARRSRSPASSPAATGGVVAIGGRGGQPG